MDLRIACVAPGWLELLLGEATGPVPATRALARYEYLHQRAVVTALVVVGEALDAAALKLISVAQVETRLNHPDFIDRGKLANAKCEAISDALADYFDKVPRPAEGRVSLSGSGGLSFGRRTLSRPDGSDPEAFYRAVADAYNQVVLTGKPAQILAEDAGVPTPTVHRWIREARRRGFLPQARRGRAG